MPLLSLVSSVLLSSPLLRVLSPLYQQVLDSALREFKFELPGTATTSLHVDANHIRDTRSTLENLLAKLSSSSTTSESQSDAPTR